jgi:hypothetical protein
MCSTARQITAKIGGDQRGAMRGLREEQQQLLLLQARVVVRPASPLLVMIQPAARAAHAVAGLLFLLPRMLRKLGRPHRHPDFCE